MATLIPFDNIYLYALRKTVIRVCGQKEKIEDARHTSFPRL
jgi:hypothetical protein